MYLDDVSAALLLPFRLTAGLWPLTPAIVVRIHEGQPIRYLTLINTFSILAILRRVEGVTTIRNRIGIIPVNCPRWRGVTVNHYAVGSNPTAGAN